MTTLLFWGAAILATLGAVGFAAWLAGHTKAAVQLNEAQNTAENQRRLADDKATEAEIYAKPARSKPELIKLMRDKS